MKRLPDNEPVPLAAARLRAASLQAWLQAQEGAPVRCIETHLSWVLLGREFAWKLKKPVRLPFVDFSQPAARRRFCEEELRLNRRLAPALYLDVLDVCDTPAGARLGGGGPVVDAAIRMRRFPDGALWTEMLAQGRLKPGHIDAMAARLADFHRDAAVAPPDSDFGGAVVNARVAGRLVEAMDTWHEAAKAQALAPDRVPPNRPESQGAPSSSAASKAAPSGGAASKGLASGGAASNGTVAHDPREAPPDWPALRKWLGGQVPELAPLWEARRRAGRVRECHGDLHLANVLQLDGEASAFDGIEFDDGLRWIDVLNDVAFLAMDLMAHGERPLAFRFLGAYLEASGDYDGLPALRFYLVCRALVRAQVAGIAEGQGVHSAASGATADYLALAAALAGGGDPRLAITHGLPGSGKSSLSQGIVEAAGAIRIRSDVERKRLFGLDALQASRELVPAGIYDAATTARTYGRVHQVARLGLLAGWPMIVDAAFLRRPERDQFAALAQTLGVPFTILDCRAPLPVLRERLERRKAAGGDASEADVEVLERLLEVTEPLAADERLVTIDCDAATPTDTHATARRWLAARSR